MRAMWWVVLCAACSGGSTTPIPPGAGAGEFLIESLVNANSPTGMQSSWGGAFKPTDVCTRTQVGPCVVQPCDGIAPVDPKVDAGTLMLTGAAQPISENPGSGKYEGGGGITNG